MDKKELRKIKRLQKILNTIDSINIDITKEKIIIIFEDNKSAIHINTDINTSDLKNALNCKE